MIDVKTGYKWQCATLEGFEGYVFYDGGVVTTDSGRRLDTLRDKYGRELIILARGGTNYVFYLDVLIARLFICDRVTKDAKIIHIDGNNYNSADSNLFIEHF